MSRKNRNKRAGRETRAADGSPASRAGAATLGAQGPAGKGRPSAFQLEVELLEDLHSGAGVGNGIIDRLHARDHTGVPVVPRSQVRGFWKKQAALLIAMRRMEIEVEKALLGGSTQGCLVAPELKAQGTRTLTWDAVARQTGSRVPAEDTLRRTEYVPAGIKLSGVGYLDSPVLGLRDALERIIRATNHLGAEGTRGSGLLRVTSLKWSKPASSGPYGPPEAWPDASAVRLRLLLKALMPVCIPTTGSPGNIIPSESFIPGRTLLGALAGWAVRQGRRPDPLLDHRVLVGPAYPLPRGWSESESGALDAFELIPTPLSLYAAKPSVRPFTSWPGWAERGGEGAAVREMLDHPQDADPSTDAASADPTRYKRPRPDAYLFRARTGAWVQYLSPTVLQMRNRRASTIEDIPDEETKLFSQTQIPANTCFVADLEGPRESVAELCTVLGGLLPTGGSGPQGQSGSAWGLLRVGRGGALVEVAGWTVSAAPGFSVGDGGGAGERLRVTLTSDLVARSRRTLGFYPELSAEVLLESLDLDPGMARELRQRRFSESERHQGFNASSGLPTAPRLVIRRGSVLQLEGQAVPEIRSALAGRRRLGERCWEGYGAFRVDLDPCGDGIGAWSANDTAPPGPAESLLARREAVLADAQGFLARLRERNLHLPSRSQLGNLRQWLAGQPPGVAAPDFDRDLREFGRRAERRRAGSLWGGLFGEGDLVAALGSCRDNNLYRTEDVELFLRAVTLETGED